MEKRMMYLILSSHYDEKNGYRPVVVVENSIGFREQGGGGVNEPEAWCWGHSYDEACETARQKNQSLGISVKDEMEILRSAFSINGIFFEPENWAETMEMINKPYVCTTFCKGDFIDVIYDCGETPAEIESMTRKILALSDDEMQNLVNEVWDCITNGMQWGEAVEIVINENIQ